MSNPVYNMVLEKSGIQLIPGMKIDQISGNLDELYGHMETSNRINRGVFKEQEWVAGYATMYSREAIDKVGMFDTRFRNGCEDLDLCKRLKKFNYKIGQALDSFIFHFGGISRGAYQIEDKEHYDEEDKYNHFYLNEKYSKKSVLLYSGPSFETWDFRNVDHGGIGGSETWQVCLARELDKLGYRVTVMCDCPEPGIKDGNIEYWHYSQYGNYVDQYWIDYFISSRTTDTLKFPVRAGKIFVMVHDIFLLSERTQLFPEKVTKYCVLSDWHRKFFSEYHGVPNDKIVNTANGIDFSRYEADVKRDPYRMFWSSSLDRGLDTLLYLFPFIKKEIPRLELHIFYGIYNWKKSAELRNDFEQLKKIDALEKTIANMEGVVFHDRIGQKELAIEQKKSSLWAYPTDFEEVFCITAVEAQRAGCPVIASNYAGLQTTIGKSGVLIGSGNKGESYTQAFRQEFVNKCIEILDDSQKWNEWSGRGFENTRKYSWANVALMWKKLFEE